jgi:hypothetical protein
MLFELTSMDRVFEIFPTRADFENSVVSTSWCDIAPAIAGVLVKIDF